MRSAKQLLLSMPVLYFCTGAPGPTRARRSCRSHPTRMGVHVWEVGPCDAGVLLRSRPRVTYEKVDLHGSPVKINIVKENCCEPATRAAGGRHSIHDICDTSGCVSHIVIKRERQIFCLSEHYFCPWLGVQFMLMTNKMSARVPASFGHRCSYIGELERAIAIGGKDLSHQ